jgi:5'-nucleotidase/UDP-sugar diphosphatase
MAAQLSDVDVIIGGDSHTLLGDFSAIGIDASSGPYPTVVRNRDGDPVCIGQAWEYAKALRPDAGPFRCSAPRWRAAAAR